MNKKLLLVLIVNDLFIAAVAIIVFVFLPAYRAAKQERCLSRVQKDHEENNKKIFIKYCHSENYCLADDVNSEYYKELRKSEDDNLQKQTACGKKVDNTLK